MHREGRKPKFCTYQQTITNRRYDYGDDYDIFVITTLSVSLITIISLPPLVYCHRSVLPDGSPPEHSEGYLVFQALAP